jgi:hypothetical protein
MSFDWEPDGDPNGHPCNFERANPFGDYATFEEAQIALAKLTVWDENFQLDPPPVVGSIVIYWIWRETAMASRMLEIEVGDRPHRKRDEWGRPIKPPLEIERELS